jgi:hypothetical protein
MKFARIEDEKVVEIYEGDRLPEFHPSLVWVEANEAVEEGWHFDGNSFSSPESLKTVDEVKAERLKEVSALRNQKYKNGFMYQDNLFQCDLEAQKDMTAIMLQFALGNSNPHGGSWRTSNNEAIQMSDSEVQIFIQATFAYVYAIKNQAWLHKENINNLNAKQDILDYDITVGWPT